MLDSAIAKNVNSVKGIAYLYLQMKKFDDAKNYYRKATELDPNDPEPYYSVGRDRLDRRPTSRAWKSARSWA